MTIGLVYERSEQGSMGVYLGRWHLQWSASGRHQALCLIVIIGVNERVQKRFLAIEDGVRESTQNWREVLLHLKNRGMNQPKLTIGDGVMGFWATMKEIYPETSDKKSLFQRVNAGPDMALNQGKSGKEKSKKFLFDLLIF